MSHLIRSTLALLLFIGLGLFAFSFFNALNDTATSSNKQEASKKSKWDSKHEPHDHFAIQRAWPDLVPDVKLYQERVQQARAAAIQKSSTPGFDAEWRLEGPTNIGGRINTIALHPTDTNIIYIGNAKGGVFKTTDSGESWEPVFDDQSFQSIGHVTLDPSDPETVYVGTGDVNISGHFAIGNGLYRSVDGGENWDFLGLEKQRVISKIVVDPSDPNTLFVGSMGNPLLVNSDRGIYKSTDGGLSWEQSLYVNDSTGVIDMIMNPTDPQTIYAAAWTRVRTTQSSFTSSAHARIYKTTDGGENWSILAGGLPDDSNSRIGLTISQQNPDKLFAVYVDFNNSFKGIYKSSDAGNSWEQIAFPGESGLPSNPLGGFGWYFGKIAVNPYNDDQIFLLGVDLFESIDGGYTWDYGTPIWWLDDVHADKHHLVFQDSTNWVLATDGGLYKTSNGFDGWYDKDEVPNTQFYRISYNPHHPGEYHGGTQDNGTIKGSADAPNEWVRYYGGDGFQVRFHPTDSLIQYAESQYGNIGVSTNGGTDFMDGNSSYDTGDRTNWDTPYDLSPHDPDILYRGSYRVWWSTAGPVPAWEVLSPDLTDGNIYGNQFHTISCLTESPVDQFTIYAGTTDGNVWRTLDQGINWDSIHHNGIADRYITNVHASPHVGERVYVTTSGYKGNSYDPHIYRSDDNGDSWIEINGDLPEVGVNDILALPEDLEENVLFAATDAGVYASLNAGQNWERLGSNPPFVHVFDIDYDPVNRRLLAGTFARSLLTYPLDSLLDYSEFDYVGQNENSEMQQLDIQLSPNPCRDLLNIEFNAPASSAYNIQITDLQGRVFHQASKKSDRFSIDVSQLPQAVYILSLESERSRISKRFLKK